MPNTEESTVSTKPFIADLDALLKRVPESFRPVIARYGPALVKMTAEEFAEWLRLLLLGRTWEAWQNLVGKLDDDAMVMAWKNLDEQWAKANTAEAARWNLQRRAAMAVLQVLLTAALAAVGL